MGLNVPGCLENGMDDLLSRLVPRVLDSLWGRLTVIKDSSRSYLYIGCSLVSESDLIDDINSV